METSLSSQGDSSAYANDNDIKPHRIRYYLEKRDPEFDRKMQEVLMVVYQDISLFPAGTTDDNRSTPIYTVSVDEKPGVQAIGLTAPDFRRSLDKNLLLHEIMSTELARTFLRHIRVASKEELKERILKGIAEINESPVRFRWKEFDLELV